MRIFKICVFILLIGFGLGILYSYLSKDPLVARLTITGKTSQEEVEWKKPYSELEKATLPTKEVVFAFHGGDEVQMFFWGDLIGVRYKVIELRPFFHWIGWKDPLEIDFLCSDYLSLENKRRFPQKCIPIEKAAGQGWKKAYMSAWEGLFSIGSSNFFVKRVSLQVEYVPLTDTKSSFLFFNTSGSLQASKAPPL